MFCKLLIKFLKRHNNLRHIFFSVLKMTSALLIATNAKPTTYTNVVGFAHSQVTCTIKAKIRTSYYAYINACSTREFNSKRVGRIEFGVTFATRLSLQS